MKKAILILSSIVLITIGLLLVINSIVSLPKKLESINLQTKIYNKFSLVQFKSSCEVKQLYDSFPYSKFLNSINCFNVNSMYEYLNQMDSITKNDFLSENILNRAFTNELSSRLNIQNIDSIYSILLWSDGINSHSICSSKHNSFFKSVADYWYDYSSNSLNQHIKSNPNLKYDFRYRYLIEKCGEKNYKIDIGNTKMEKVVLYIIDSKWKYLFDRFWNGTSKLFKFFLFTGSFIIFIIITIGIKYLIIKLR